MFDATLDATYIHLFIQILLICDRLQTIHTDTMNKLMHILYKSHNNDNDKPYKKAEKKPAPMSVKLIFDILEQSSWIVTCWIRC